MKKNSTISGCQSPSIRFGGTGRRFLTPHPAARAGDLSSAPARACSFPFLSKLDREKVRLGAAICRAIDRGRASGHTLDYMARRFAQKYKTRGFKSDPRRPIHFGYLTILRWHDRWITGGKTAGALLPHYKFGGFKIRTPEVRGLIRQAVRPQIDSFQKAYAGLPKPAGTWTGFYSATPTATRKMLMELFRVRRQAKALSRRAGRLAARLTRSLPIS